MSQPLPYEYFELTEEERTLIQAWEQQLPPIIARKHVEWFTGGVLKRQRLAVADSEGKGPVDPIRVGRCISYWTRHLLVWMAKDRGVTQMQTLTPVIQSRGCERSEARS
jgi:hypothetical protein